MNLKHALTDVAVAVGCGLLGGILWGLSGDRTSHYLALFIMIIYLMEIKKFRSGKLKFPWMKDAN
ncbi:MAG: hypothetical protein B6U86_02230 [Candidatus Altiarchaeales archaeon ex4484_43]|nr:MAG: hypothetical protein B6U86_02230 [Candidatus Altiarchaeales archaeon ex4484_43]